MHPRHTVQIIFQREIQCLPLGRQKYVPVLQDLDSNVIKSTVVHTLRAVNNAHTVFF